MYKPKYDSPKTYYLHVKCYQCLRKKIIRSKFDSVSIIILRPFPRSEHFTETTERLQNQ